jgi:5-methyltetrahydrofolate--homocysteine methyltransferase
VETRLTSRSREVVVSGDRPFVIIGERINPTGRKVLAAEMKDGVMDRVRSDAMAQAAAGAHMLEAGLSAYQGKALVNSVTAEDERMERILPLVKKHGAAVIGMANDETGISMVPAERLELARRIVERAMDHGIPKEDVIIDPIAMTVAADPTCGLVTLETMRLIRDELGSNMTCGASNVSFGLPDRPAVNAAFLPLAMHAGLTCAITNPLEAQVRRAILAGDLLLGHDEYAMRWIASFRAEQARAVAR